MTIFCVIDLQFFGQNEVLKSPALTKHSNFMKHLIMTKMNIYSVKKKQSRSINIFWNKALRARKPFANRGFVVHDEIIIGSLLFVGINPSYNSSKSKSENIYLNLKQDGTMPDGKLYQYFKKFPEISEYVGLPWSHLDLLLLRETKQSKIKDLYEKEAEYILSQLKIAKTTIISIKPKAVVICNAFASNLFNKHMFKTRFNESIGTHVIKSKKLNGTPVFFSGMLSGQRALDLGSLERLKWHIKTVVE